MKVAVLDRDGIINIDYGYVYEISEFEFVDGIFDLTSRLQKNDYSLIVCTNQSGIGRGYYSKKKFEIVNAWMLNVFKKKGIKILDTFYCPHIPDDNCNCRKPLPGLFFKASEKYNIDFSNSIMIGDKYSDIIASSKIGIKNRILVNKKLLNRQNLNLATMIVGDLKELKNFDKI